MMPSTRTGPIWAIKKRPREWRPLVSGSRLLLEAALDPVGALHALGRIDRLRRVALDVDQRQLAVHQLVLAVGRLHDRLVSLADRHAHGAAGTFEAHVLQRLADFLVRRPLAAVGGHRL